MNIEILNSNNKVVDVIVADEEFAEMVYPGQWRIAEIQPDIPSEIEPVILPITTCSKAQGLIALYIKKGITEQDILDTINNLPDPTEKYMAQVSYNNSNNWLRGSPTVDKLAQLLSLTPQDIDELYEFASTVVL